MNGLSSFWSYPEGGTLTKTLTKSIYDFQKSKKPRIARQASKLAQVIRQRIVTSGVHLS